MLLNVEERQQRQIEKQQALLDFLKYEVYSDQAILSRLLKQNTRWGFQKSIKRFIDAGIVRRYDFQIVENRCKALYGITPHGLGLAFDPDTDQDVQSKYFSPNRMSPYGLGHHLGLQALRLDAEQHLPAVNWQKGEQLGKLPSGVNRPDVLLRFDDEVVVIEYERTFKSIKRYEEIMGNYLVTRKEGKYHRVIYVCPNQHMSLRLKGLFHKITTVVAKGKRESLRDEHYQFFTFCTPQNWLDTLNEHRAQRTLHAV